MRGSYHEPERAYSNIPFQSCLWRQNHSLTDKQLHSKGREGMGKAGWRGYLSSGGWPWLPSRWASLLPSLKHTHAASMAPCGSQWLPRRTGLRNLALASGKMHHPVVNLTVLGRGWKKNGNLAEWQPETWHETIVSWYPHTYTLPVLQRVCPTICKSPASCFVHTYLYLSASFQYSQCTCLTLQSRLWSSLCLWLPSALEQFLSLCLSSPPGRAGPVTQTLIRCRVVWLWARSLFQMISYKTSWK